MYCFKDIDKTSTVIEQNVINYTQTVTTSSQGINTHRIVSGSISQSYWNSLNNLFYTSGSPVYGKESKFGLSLYNLAISQKRGTQYLTKFHGYPSSSVISIPQQYFSEKIKEKSFIYKDSNYSDNDGNKPTIKDDGFGNLYSTNAHHSQSINNISHSDNYVGNIFYEQGLVIITETGSWSGSTTYSDFGKNYQVKFGAHNPIVTHEYSVTLMPGEFNKSMNYTLRMPLSGTYSNMAELTSSILANPYLAQQFTGSNFTPYITTINLYQKGDYDTPVMIARVPKAIRKSNKISTTFKIRLDL
tara:strand:- start:293 stop:1195 length:903 start_codon:yes stop_codon:yes gene_type:complete